MIICRSLFIECFWGKHLCKVRKGRKIGQREMQSFLKIYIFFQLRDAVLKTVLTDLLGVSRQDKPSGLSQVGSRGPGLDPVSARHWLGLLSEEGGAAERGRSHQLRRSPKGGGKCGAFAGNTPSSQGSKNFNPEGG